VELIDIYSMAWNMVVADAEALEGEDEEGGP
jgi:hypothetical protein